MIRIFASVNLPEAEVEKAGTKRLDQAGTASIDELIC